LLDTSNPDVLSLTEKGFSENPSVDEVHKIFKRIHGSFVSKKGKKETAQAIDAVEIETDPSHKKELLEMLLTLPPAGFERLCQRLLRASGFKRVVVKGRSGDGGIDGEGILEINPLVSMKVIFQSKRYKDAVSSSQIRDFRGALQGRAEKGIFITTGRFTKEAKAEAVREGAPPIEIVDGDKLVKLFEKGGLGLRKKEIFEVDKDFFIEYM
jgi:restriction system protein